MSAASQGGQKGPASDGAIYRFLQCMTGQYMTRDAISVTRDVTMRELGLLFERHDFNSFPVLDQGKMVGIVTKFDFLKAFAFTIGQMVPHYDDLMRRTVFGRDERGRRARRADDVTDPGSPGDGKPHDPQPAGDEPGGPVGGDDLPRGRHARLA